MVIKKIIRIGIILLLIPTFSFATTLAVEHNFDTALKKAKEQHKDIMMMYSAAWCPECEYMKDVVFKDPTVANHIQEHYVLLILDIKKDKLPKGFNHIGIPTFFFIDQEGKEQHRIIGGAKAGKFLKKLEAVR